MQPLTAQLEETISHLHDVFTPRVFVAVCRGYWDRTARVRVFSSYELFVVNTLGQMIVHGKCNAFVNCEKN